MANDDKVTEHYAHGALVEALRDGLASIGKTPDTVAPDDLEPVEHMHVGWRQATETFMAQLELTAGARVLDVGSGMGGPARHAARRYGARVTGIDLSPEFVAAARELSRWVGVEAGTEFMVANALDMPFGDASFDAAYMMHVGMNIADKAAVFREVARVLKPGGMFGIYDEMRTGEGEVMFPLPWAARPEISALAGPDDYRKALRAAGFTVRHESNRHDFAVAAFARLMAQLDAEGPAAFSLETIMASKNRTERMRNLETNIKRGEVTPVEMFAVLDGGS